MGERGPKFIRQFALDDAHLLRGIWSRYRGISPDHVAPSLTCAVFVFRVLLGRGIADIGEARPFRVT